MSVQPRYPAEIAHALHTLELACRAVADVAARLDRAGGEATALFAATDWQTASARQFRRRAQDWRSDLDALRDTARLLDHDVGTARTRALAEAWWAGG